MIKSITGRDFQSHKDTRVEFGPGVNCIVGTSDSGKTSILRMLYWVLTNRPITSSFIRNGSGSVGARGAAKVGTAEVEINVVREGQAISIHRAKGHEINTCKVGDKEFSTLGKDVPEEVLEALNLQTINIQRQRDPAFLIDDSPGQVAATFNRFTDLDKVDGVVSILTSDIKQCTMNKKRMTEDIEKLTTQIASFSHLEEMEEFVAALESVEEDILHAGDDQGRLEELLAAISAVSIDLKAVTSQATAAKNKLVEANKLDVELEAVRAQYDTAIEDANNIRTIVDSTTADQAELTRITARIPLAKKEIVAQKKLISLARDLDDAEVAAHRIDGLLDAIFTTEDDIAMVVSKLSELRIKLSEAKTELGDVDTCALCEQKLSKAGKEAMLRNLK